MVDCPDGRDERGVNLGRTLCSEARTEKVERVSCRSSCYTSKGSRNEGGDRIGQRDRQGGEHSCAQAVGAELNCAVRYVEQLRRNIPAPETLR